MQDRYVADVGDFGKYGLLRFLAGTTADRPRLKLAVLWYAVPNESHNNDGRHIGYLRTPVDGEYARCDRVLFDRLRVIAAAERRLSAVEQARILPAGTRFHGVPLQFERFESAKARRAKRYEWFRSATNVAAGADVVFLDPDNGLECGTSCFSRTGPKYAYHTDLEHLCGQERTLIVYHHLSRQGTADEQILRRAARLAGIVPSTHLIGALRFRRGSARAYFLFVAPQHVDSIRVRLRAFLSGPWSNHFSQTILSIDTDRRL